MPGVEDRGRFARGDQRPPVASAQLSADARAGHRGLGPREDRQTVVHGVESHFVEIWRAAAALDRFSRQARHRVPALFVEAVPGRELVELFEDLHVPDFHPAFVAWKVRNVNMKVWTEQKF